MSSIVDVIVAELDGHIATLQAARLALLNNGQSPKAAKSVKKIKTVVPLKKAKVPMSAEARKKIGMATKKRWASKVKASTT